MEQTYSYVNGELVLSEQATVSVFDHGFTVADGVFETLRFESGSVFAVDLHIQRLARSAQGLGIASPDLKTLHRAIDQVAKANSHVANGRMRITVTSGRGPLGSDRLSEKQTLVVSVAEQKAWGKSSELLVVPWIRNELSPLVSFKTTSYAENVYALDAALKHGFSEAIFLNSHGLLTEGTGSNLFIVKSGQILTPRIENGLLPGITRQLVIDWVSPNLELREVDLTQSDLFSADEIFITSSTRNVHPVSRIAQLTADLKVNSEKILNTGIVTSEVVSIFNKNSKEQVNP